MKFNIIIDCKLLVIFMKILYSRSDFNNQYDLQNLDFYAKSIVESKANSVATSLNYSIVTFEFW